MDDLRLEKLIDETLSTIDPVEIPEDLHFDAAKIMRLARMEEEAEKQVQREEKRAPLIDLSRLRDVFQSRSWTRYAAAAAAFAILLGAYGFSQKGGNTPFIPSGGDPTHTADTEIGDNEIPLVEPEDPNAEIPVDDPVTEPDPQTQDDPQPSVPPVPPVQSGEAVKPPAPQPPAPVTPPEADPPIEEETDDPEQGTEYAGGLEVPPEEPAGPEDPEEGDVPAEPPQEDILGSLLALALQNESFAAEFAEGDKGFGYQVLKAEDVPDGTQFMVYFYESEDEAASQTVNEENIRSILWKRESL